MVLLSACESDLLKPTIGEGTAPVLNTTALDVVLLKIDSANTALTLDWTDPGYLADTSNGSVFGTYELEIDKSYDFSDPTSFSLVNTFSKSFSVYELNKLLLDMECVPDSIIDIFIRVTSIFFNTDTLASNMLTVSMTPFPTYIPPAIEVPAELWLVGEAVNADWPTPLPVGQQFTKTGETEYSITIDLAASLDYEMITDSEGENWTPCYRIHPDVTPGDMLFEGTFVWDGEGSEFGWATNKFLSPPDAGTYTITMDFQNAAFTTVLQ